MKKLIESIKSSHAFFETFIFTVTGPSLIGWVFVLTRHNTDSDLFRAAFNSFVLFLLYMATLIFFAFLDLFPIPRYELIHVYLRSAAALVYLVTGVLIWYNYRKGRITEMPLSGLIRKQLLG